MSKTRETLWKADPHCYWCNRITTLYRSHRKPSAKKKKNRDLLEVMATIDHLYSRYHPFRKRYSKERVIPIVLACARCNSHRGGFESLFCNEEKTNKRKSDPMERIEGTFQAMSAFYLKIPIEVEKIEF